jgi:hypothetical protein
MSDQFMRHFISFVGALTCLVVYWAGYISGKNGWWLTAIGIVVIYGIIYNLLDA